MPVIRPHADLPGALARRVIGGAWLWALALCLVPWAAQAADRVALVIGNDRYQHVQPLGNARNDARLFAQTLRDAGFRVEMFEDLGRNAFWRAIDDFSARVRRGDEVVFYYAGHGVQIGSEPILLPVDISPQHESQVARDGVPVHQIQDALRDAGVALLVIDACRDNPFPRRGTRSIGGTRGLVPVEAAAGMAVILSAGRGQTALDSVPGQRIEHGLFTHVLVQTLRQPGVPVRQALMRTREEVESMARQVGHEQRPALVDEMRGNFFIFRPRPAAATGARDVRLLTDAEIEQQAWDTAQRVGALAGYEAYLREYPRGRFASAARIQIAALAAAAPAAVGAARGAAGSEAAAASAPRPPAARPASSASVASAPMAAPSSPGAAVAAVAAGLQPGSTFVYRVTDRFTGNSREAVFRVDRVEGDLLHFNDGLRVETRAGRVVSSKGSIAGDLDLHEPPGGWATEELLREGEANLRYKNRAGDEVSLQARVEGEEDITVAGTQYRAVRIRYRGYASQDDGRGNQQRTTEISVWVDRTLGRPVLLTSSIRVQGNSWATPSWDRVELISRP